MVERPHRGILCRRAHQVAARIVIRECHLAYSFDPDTIAMLRRSRASKVISTTTAKTAVASNIGMGLRRWDSSADDSIDFITPITARQLCSSTLVYTSR